MGWAFSWLNLLMFKIEKKLTRPAFVTQAPELIEIYSAPVQQYLELFLTRANKIALK